MHRAGATVPVAALDRPRVGLDKAECRNRQSQEIGGDLRKVGIMALAIRLGAEHERDAAVWLEADLGAFARRAARGLEKTRDTEAAQPAALRRGPAPRSKAVGEDPTFGKYLAISGNIEYHFVLFDHLFRRANRRTILLRVPHCYCSTAHCRNPKT
jgi:hypothetical protein